VLTTIEEERWLPIQGFPGYEISDWGRVRNPRGKLLKPFANSGGYLYVALYGKVKEKKMRVHRLVLSHFSCPLKPGHTVNHINGTKTDNRLSNLEWMTMGENTRHARDVLGYDFITRPVTPIRGTHVETGEVIEFHSQREAGRSGFDQSAINHALTGLCKTHRGYRWQYIQAPA
jgi:hypothetical protein